MYAMKHTETTTHAATMSDEKSLSQAKASKWRQRMQSEAEHGPKVFVDVLLDTDVLLGKHRDAFNHIGNRTFRTLIHDHWERYNHAAGRGERTAIVGQIVDFLRGERQVRFLKRDNATGRWFMVHDSVAREKVGHAIRDAINFRRHHLRKMAEEPLRNESAYMDFHRVTTTLDYPPPCQVPSSQRPLGEWTATGGSPPSYTKSHPVLTEAIHATKNYTLTGDHFVSTGPHVMHKVADKGLQVHDCVRVEDSGIDADRYIIRSDPLINDSVSHSSTCIRPKINLIVSNEAPSFEEEAAMMGAFSVWASQTYADATVALKTER
jgi:uncharacterized protein (DUF4415 family)